MTEAHYGLDADPADNPYQTDPVYQSMHHPGAKMHAIRRQGMQAHPLAAQTAQAYGDVYLDYSSARPSNAALLAVPRLVGVCRYLSPLNADGTYYGPTAVKMITPAEAVNLINVLRLDLKHNYEWYEGRCSEGAPAGRQDANWAATLAYRIDTAVGRSTVGRHIIYSDDTSSTPYESVVAYLIAAQTRHEQLPGGYLAGYYGPQNKVAKLAADPRITWPILLWQTCAWSGGVYGGTGHLYQAICAPVSPSLPGCDTNFRMKPDPGGDSMPTPEEYAAAVWAFKPQGSAGSTATRYLADTRADVAAIKAATDTVEPKLNALGSALANLDVAALTTKLTKAVQDALAGGIDPAVLTKAISDALGAAGYNLTVNLSGTAKPGTPA